MLYKVITHLGPTSDIEISRLNDTHYRFIISKWDRCMQRSNHYLAGYTIIADCWEDARYLADELRWEGFTIPNDIDVFEESIQ
jgi:hypothetical protein